MLQSYVTHPGIFVYHKHPRPCRDSNRGPLWCKTVTPKQVGLINLFSKYLSYTRIYFTVTYYNFFCCVLRVIFMSTLTLSCYTIFTKRFVVFKNSSSDIIHGFCNLKSVSSANFDNSVTVLFTSTRLDEFIWWIFLKSSIHFLSELEEVILQTKQYKILFCNQNKFIKTVLITFYYK